MLEAAFINQTEFENTADSKTTYLTQVDCLPRYGRETSIIH